MGEVSVVAPGGKVNRGTSMGRSPRALTAAVRALVDGAAAMAEADRAAAYGAAALFTAAGEQPVTVAAEEKHLVTVAVAITAVEEIATTSGQ